MKALLLSTCLLVSAFSAAGQNFKTVVAPPDTTNVLEITLGQTVRIVNMVPYSPDHGSDGQVVGEFGGRECRLWKGDIIQGPARFFIYADLYDASLITVEYLNEPTSPDRTLILPHGTNAVAVSLEVSTNLTQWVTTTNGVYVPGETPHFFRIKAAK